MKENVTVIHEQLRQGLKRERLVRNQVALLSAVNVRATTDGLDRQEPITIPEAWAVSAWPFPQVFQGQTYKILVDATDLYVVDGESLDSVALYDLRDKEESKTITAGGSWQFMDFGPTFALTNGVCSVIRMGGEGKFYVDDTVPMNTLCRFRGRWMAGGFTPSSSWSLEFQYLLKAWAERCDRAMPLMDLSSNFVRWGQIGGGDLESLFRPELLLYGEKDSKLFDMIDRGDFGFMPMPFSGAVLCMKQLGDKVIVYGEDGIAVLFPSIEHIPTFGMKPIEMGIGLAGRGCVAGGDGYHVFLDRYGDLWRLGNDLGLERLGYKAFLSDLDFDVTVMSRDPSVNEIHISDGTDSYLLTPLGLTESGYSVTSIVNSSDGLEAPGVNSGDAFQIRTDAIDFGNRGFKVIQSIEVATNGATGLYGKVYFKATAGETWSETGWVPFNDQQFAMFGVSGIEFRFAIKGDWDTDAEDHLLDRVVVRWRQHDKRNIRGYYGSGDRVEEA